MKLFQRKPARGRLLVIEDEPDTLEVLKLMLESEGHDVVAVEDGRTALATAQAKPFDVVVMDISMPQMGGVELARALRADARTADVGIAIHTGIDEQWVRERFDDYDLFLTKASDTDLLVESIGKFLEQPRKKRAAAAQAAPAGPTFSAVEALQAQRAMREAMGLGPEAFPIESFVGMLGDEIDQLRKLGKGDADIAGLIARAIGRDFAAADLAR